MNLDPDKLDDETQDYVVEEDETPVTARNRCRRLGTLLVQAEIDLKRQRYEQMQAEHDYEMSKARMMLSREAPVVQRGGATVGELDAWVRLKTEDDRLKAAVAKARVDAAWKHYDRVNTQVMLAQSILRSIDRAFALGTGADQ